MIYEKGSGILPKGWREGEALHLICNRSPPIKALCRLLKGAIKAVADHLICNRSPPIKALYRLLNGAIKALLIRRY